MAAAEPEALSASEPVAEKAAEQTPASAVEQSPAVPSGTAAAAVAHASSGSPAASATATAQDPASLAAQEPAAEASPQPVARTAQGSVQEAAQEPTPAAAAGNASGSEPSTPVKAQQPVSAASLETPAAVRSLTGVAEGFKDPSTPAAVSDRSVADVVAASVADAAPAPENAKEFDTFQEAVGEELQMAKVRAEDAPVILKAPHVFSTHSGRICGWHSQVQV